MIMGHTNKPRRASRLARGRILVLSAVFAAIALPTQAQQNTTFDNLLEKLKDKGVLTTDEYEALKQARDEEAAAQREARRKQALREAQQAEKDEKTKEAAATQTKFESSPGIQSIQPFGDLRLRYEARSATSTFPISNLAPPGTTSENLDRWRYAVRVGIRGDITENWFYGLRLDTSTNPRSAWVTFGSNTGTSSSAAPYGKGGDGLQVAQAYMGWRATPWLTLQAGKIPNPVYTTSMVWDPDINPEGIAERFNIRVNDKLDLFGNLGQYVYETYNPQTDSFAHDGYQFAWQGGLNYKFAAATSAKVALGFYNYSGFGSQPASSGCTTGSPTCTNSSANGFFGPFARGAQNTIGANAFNDGVNDLSYVEIPWEFNFPVGSAGTLGRAFGNVAYNTQADQRAAKGSYASLGSQGLAWQVGLAVGTNIGLTMNQGIPKATSSVKNQWEARVYWQQVDLNALDPNLIDSDFFEGRTNMQGLFLAFAYSPADAIIATFRFGEAHRFNQGGPTPGSNADLPNVAPISSYRLLQFDLAWRF